MIFKEFLAKRLLEFDTGRYFGATFIQFILVVAIFVKTYFKEQNVVIIASMILGTLFLVWLFGFILLKSGFYELFQYFSPMTKKVFDKLDKE